MNQLLELFPPFAEHIAWALLHSLWQGMVIAAAVGILLRMLRSHSAALRHFVCLITLITVLASAVATVLLVSPKRSGNAGATAALLTATGERASTVSPQVNGVPLRSTGSPTVTADEVANTGFFRPWRERIGPLLPWISAVWISGVMLLSARHLGGWRRVRVLRRSGVTASPELLRIFECLLQQFRPGPVHLIESVHVFTPILTGVLKPVIILPARVITGLDPAQIEAILAHELAHLVRRDTWSNLIQIVAETVLFYHPAVWWISRRMRLEREHAADDLALRVCADRRVYADALVKLAEIDAVPSVALAATGGHLLTRIRRIVSPPAAESAIPGLGVGLPALIAAVTLATLLVSRAQQPIDSAKPAADWQQETKGWMEDAFQLEDGGKRAAAIERIRAAMSSRDIAEARAGATAFIRLGPIEFDKASFRAAVRSLLASADARTRAAAASGFTLTGAEPEDLARIFALADDPAPEVRDGLTHVIVQLTKYDLTGKEATEAILKLMNNLPNDARSVAHALWGSKFSPEIEARVLEYCRDMNGFGTGYNFFYGSLSTQANKSEASVKRLIEILADQDTTNKAGRAAWGLQQGVSPAQYPLVADAMIKVIEARSDGYVRKQALQCLNKYGSGAQVPELKAILAKPGVTGEFRTSLQQTLSAIEPRPATATTASAIASAAPPASGPSAAVAQPAQGANDKPEIEVEWRGKWWGATIVKKEGEKTLIHYVGYGSDWDEWVTAERLRPISATSATAASEQSAATDSKPQRAPELVEKNRQASRVRANKDGESYSVEQLREIETLYQVANSKGKRSPEARESLTKLLEKYDKANRTGCATLYLGQASEGEERLKYLTTAVEKFSDCYYFNGCQVGGYGRYVLLLTLWERGDKDKARALLNDLKTTYKDATDHNGYRMGDVAAAVEKQLEEQAGRKQ